MVSLAEHHQPTDLISSVQRALRILELLAQHPSGLRAKQIKQHLDINLSTCYHQLNTLIASGYAVKNPDTLCFQLSGKIGYTIHGQTTPAQLVQHLTPHTQALQELTCETTYLALWDRGKIYLAAIFESPQSVRVKTLTIGFSKANHTTGWGKAILAYLDDSQVEKYFANRQLKAYTSKTLTSIDALKANLAQVRRRGYSLDLEESLVDVYCIGAPIMDAQDHVVASVCISLPGNRYQFHKKTLIPHVVNVANAATRTLSILGYGDICNLEDK
jgi:DNA-binding IclR family transcriptional regulator